MSKTSDELRDDELDGVTGGIIAILIGLLLPAAGDDAAAETRPGSSLSTGSISRWAAG